MANKPNRKVWQIVLFFIGLVLFPTQTKAQDNVTTNENSSSISNDSLLTLVQQLQKRQDDADLETKWTKIWDKRKKHWSISYITSQKLTLKDNENIESKSKFGINIQRGRTWYLPHKPLGGMVKFGIDLDPMDITYVQYESDPVPVSSQAPTYTTDEKDDETDWGRHHITYGIGVGASVTVNPIDYLKASAFFHYIPGVGALIYDSNVSWGYQGMCSFGFNVAWKAISLGFETRWGSSTFSKIDIDEVQDNISDIEEDDFDYDGTEVSVDYDPFSALTTDKQKIKIKSFLVTLAFRF